MLEKKEKHGWNRASIYYDYYFMLAHLRVHLILFIINIKQVNHGGRRGLVVYASDCGAGRPRF